MLNRVELRQLAYFEAVARLGGFSRAAEALHVAQPAISAQVRRLERELGTTLFERTTRRVAMTQAGQLLLVRARAALAEIDGARSDLDQLAAVVRGHLRLGVTPVLGPLDLPALLASFHRRYPEATLAVRSGRVTELLAALDAGRVDALLAPIHLDLPSQYQARRLVEENLTLITVPGKLPGAARAVSLGEVRDQPFVCLPPGSGLHDILTTAAAAAGFSPHIPFQAPDPASIRSFVAAGLGVAMLAESAARSDGPHIDVHPLRPAPPHPPIGLITDRRAPVTPTLRAWLQHLERTLPDRG
jgi:LysR family transcriptional activator of glutamate synthase operon